jgi:hypothetical protein
MDPRPALTFEERFARFKREHELLHRFTLAEEDRRLFTTATRSGSYRWFRSLNVIQIEQARLLLREREGDTAASCRLGKLVSPFHLKDDPFPKTIWAWADHFHRDPRGPAGRLDQAHRLAPPRPSATRR